MTRRTALCIGYLLLTSGVAQAQLQEPTGFHAGFEYEPHVTLIGPQHHLTLKEIARDAVLTASKRSAVDIAVIGHADFDLKGRAFELEKSRERAENAASWLEFHIHKMVLEMQMPISVRTRIRISHKGIGTQDPINARPTTDDQRKANRRVNFKWTVTP